MKKWFLVVTIMMACGVWAADSDLTRQALDGALEAAKAALPMAELQGKAVAVLPFQKDSTGTMTGKVKNLLTSAGLVCLEGKEDPMWDEIIKEVAWNERKNDILDPATLLKFGKLKSAQVLVYGKISALDVKDDRVYAEIELHATELATRRHLWGGTFAKRVYSSPNLRGLVDLSPEIRQLLKKSFDESKASIKEAGAAARLANVKTVAVVPLAGDVDEYMTGLAIGMLTDTTHTPRNPRIPSVSQLRAFAKDGLAETDAMLYGAVRDLSERIVDVSLDAEKRQKVTRKTVNAEIQLFVEDMKNGDILWSKTVAIAEPQVDTVSLTEAEMVAERDRLERERQAKREQEKKLKKEKLEDIPDDIKGEVADNWKSILKWIGIGIGGVVSLFVVLAILKGLLGNVFIK
ncbi:MAG: hypothetical protein IJU61_14755 [Victivallales bacterium]|nr:hypothetical protein [Victivallales bacterium]